MTGGCVTFQRTDNRRFIGCFADNMQCKGVKGFTADIFCVQTGADPFIHLIRRLPPEGEHQDLLRQRLLTAQQPAGPCHQHRCFTAPGSRQYQHGRLTINHRLTLRSIQRGGFHTGKEIHVGFKALLCPFAVALTAFFIGVAEPVQTKLIRLCTVVKTGQTRTGQRQCRKGVQNVVTEFLTFRLCQPAVGLNHRLNFTDLFIQHTRADHAHLFTPA